jgi:hypothetical protein
MPVAEELAGGERVSAGGEREGDSGRGRARE